MHAPSLAEPSQSKWSTVLAKKWATALNEEASRNRLVFMGVLVWTAALVAAFQPGLMSSDSIDQYGQGLQGAYNDIHPPLGSWLLGISGKLTGSPWPVLVAQLLALGLCMAALVRSPQSKEGRWGMLVMGLFLLTPTVWALAVTLWKDVMTAAVLLGAIAALKFRRPAIALVLLMAGVAFRHNAIIAAVPLAIPTALQWAPPRWGGFRKASLLAVMMAGLALSPSMVSRALDSTRAWAAGQLFIFDLAGIYAAHPDLVSRSMLSNETSSEEIVRLYTPLHVWPLFGGVEGARPIAFTSLGARRRELRDEWARMIRERPGTWLRHRLASFASLVGATPEPVYYPFHLSIDPNPFHLRVPSEGWSYRTLHEIKMRLANTLVFRGWAWLLLLTALALVALRQVRQKPIAFCTAVSGLGYALAYFFVGIGSDFRFIYWSIISVFATLALLITEQSTLWPGSQARPAPPPQD